MSQRRAPRDQAPPAASWDFFRFEVLVAFFAGVFLATIVVSFELGGYLTLHFWLFIISLFVVSWAAARIVSRGIVAARARGRRERAEEEERERRALAARARAADIGEVAEPPRRRRRRRRQP